MVHFLKNHFKIHFQTTPPAGLMDWEFPVGGTSTINVFSIQKKIILLLQRARSVGIIVNHRDPGGEWVEIPNVTIDTPSEQPLLDFSLLLLLVLH